MKTILRLAFVVVLAFGWLPAAAQGEAPVDVPEPSLVSDPAAVENSEPYPLELVGQVFLPALGTDHDGANAMASSAVDAGTVKAADTFTMDTRYNERDYFYSGEAIKYIGIAANTTGAARTATLQWRLTGPCGAGVLWSGVKQVAAGVSQWWVLNRVIPACNGDYVFTFSVTYAGVKTSHTSNFSVVDRFDGGLKLSNVRITDKEGKIIQQTYHRTPVLFRLDISNDSDKEEIVTVSYYSYSMGSGLERFLFDRQFKSKAHTTKTFDVETIMTWGARGRYRLRVGTSFGDQGESQIVWVLN